MASIDSKIAAAAAKVPLWVIPFKALWGLARVFYYGSKKHGLRNYLSATDVDAPNRYMGGVFRHECSMQEEGGGYTWESISRLDDESGIPEIDHAIAGLVMLRAAAVKKGVLPADPGVGNEPPSKEML